jgi:protein-S-isoprenylcysteine O-methyltransferase Ste14
MEAGPLSSKALGIRMHAGVTLILKNLLFTLVVPASVGVYVPLWLARASSPRSGVMLPISGALIAVGAGCYLWSVWNFALRGRGTPLPFDAPKRLVIQGPYRYTRNPMYLGVFVALSGWLLLFQSLVHALYLLAIVVAVNLYVIGYEEPHLRQVFGSEYAEYMARVPRWLPRIPSGPDA